MLAVICMTENELIELFYIYIYIYIYMQVGRASAEADGTEKEKVRVTQLPQAIARGKSILALPHTIPCE